jgi:hypothetical protein
MWSRGAKALVLGATVVALALAAASSASAQSWTLVCAPNKSIQCGGSVTFNNPTVVNGGMQGIRIRIESTVTNINGCVKTYTRTWRAIDGYLNIQYCSQTITEDCCQPGGCTPGYWKQDQHFDSWVGYTQGQTLDSVFTFPVGNCGGALDGLGDDTLLEALQYNKSGPGLDGAAMRLLRHGVAALLNSANASVNYPLSSAQVIDLVNNALASCDEDQMTQVKDEILERYNEAGCPLN